MIRTRTSPHAEDDREKTRVGFLITLLSHITNKTSHHILESDTAKYRFSIVQISSEFNLFKLNRHWRCSHFIRICKHILLPQYRTASHYWQFSWIYEIKITLSNAPYNSFISYNKIYDISISLEPILKIGQLRLRKPNNVPKGTEISTLQTGYQATCNVK